MRIVKFERRQSPAQKFGQQASAIAQTIAEQAAITAVASADRAKGFTKNVAKSGRDYRFKKSDIQEPVADFQRKMSEDVIPTLRDVAVQAAALALELWETGRERASDIAGTAQHDYGSQASHLKDTTFKRAGGVRDETTKRVAHARHEATKRAGEVREEAAKRAIDAKKASARRASDATSIVTDRAGDVAERAKSSSKHAVDTTVDTSKDTGELVFWLGAASAVVYFAFLDPKRRDQVRKLASEAMHTFKKSVDDMRQSEPSNFSEAA